MFPPAQSTLLFCTSSAFLLNDIKIHRLSTKLHTGEEPVDYELHSEPHMLGVPCMLTLRSSQPSRHKPKDKQNQKGIWPISVEMGIQYLNPRNHSALGPSQRHMVTRGHGTRSPVLSVEIHPGRRPLLKPPRQRW